MTTNIPSKPESTMGFTIDFIIPIVGLSKSNLVVFCLRKGPSEESATLITTMSESLQSEKVPFSICTLCGRYETASAKSKAWAFDLDSSISIIKSSSQTPWVIKLNPQWEPTCPEPTIDIFLGFIAILNHSP